DGQPEITMEEYIRLEEEKARRHGKVYNWETAKYDFFKDFENEFPAIIYNDALTSKSDHLTEPTLSPQHIDEFDLKNETSLSKYDEVEQDVLYFNDLFPFNIIHPDDLKSDKDNNDNKINIIQSLGGKLFSKNEYDVLELMDEGLKGRMLMEHKDAQGQSVFTSRAWRRQFEIRGPLVHKLILEFFCTIRFGETVLYLDTGGALQFQLGRVRRHICWREFIVGMGLHIAKEIESVGFNAYWGESVRQILDKGDLSAYWIGILSTGDFLGTGPSYTFIKDPMLRLCHRLNVCSIAGRSQVPEKVTVTDLFYLKGMDIGSVNISYLLARYLRLFPSGRKYGAMIFEGRFVSCLAEHFRLLTEKRLQGLTVIVRDMPVIDMAELLTLHICVELDDTWAWVALGSERQ
nr:hypothetical protein [Tanacetum cinerariifolium]